MRGVCIISQFLLCTCFVAYLAEKKKTQPLTVNRLGLSRQQCQVKCKKILQLGIFCILFSTFKISPNLCNITKQRSCDLKPIVLPRYIVPEKTATSTPEGQTILHFYLHVCFKELFGMEIEWMMKFLFLIF